MLIVRGLSRLPRSWLVLQWAGFCILAVIAVLHPRRSLAQPPVRAGITSPTDPTPTRPLPADPLPTDEEWQFRFDLFQMLLEQNGLKPITSVDEALENPSTTVIVSLGRIDPRFPIDQVPSFVSSGSMLIAMDQGFRYPALMEMAAGPVRARLAEDRYHDFADCVRVTDIARSDSWISGLDSIIANRSGWITSLSPALGTWRIDARLPQSLNPMASSGAPLIASLAPRAMTDQRLIIAADQTLFSNGMVWHGDNAVLAIKISQALRRPGQNRLLFLVDGQPQPSYLRGPVANEIPPPPAPVESMPEVELEQMLKVANMVVAKVEDADLFNELLANQPRGMSNLLYRRVLLFVALIALLIYVLYRFAPRATAAVTGSQTPPRAMVSAYALGATKGQAIDRRGAVAQIVAREFLSEVSGSIAPEQWRAKVVAAARATGDKGTREKLLYILSLAENARAPLLSSSKLKEVGRTLDELRAILSTQSQGGPRRVRL